MLPRNPASAARATVAAAQLGTFLDALDDDPLHVAYVLVAPTGMRRGEVMGLRCLDETTVTALRRHKVRQVEDRLLVGWDGTRAAG